MIRDREEFLNTLTAEAKTAGIRLLAPQRKAILAALGEPDPQAKICYNSPGNPEPDPKLRDTETLTFAEPIDDYMTREVLPHHPNAWVDHKETKTGIRNPT